MANEFDDIMFEVETTTGEFPGNRFTPAPGVSSVALPFSVEELHQFAAAGLFDDPDLPESLVAA